MKRLATLLVCVFVAILILPCLNVEASTRRIPHEDPSAAQSSIDSFSFLSQYAQVFTLISSEQYANASKLSQQLSLISVPADLSYILNRYNNLTQQFISTLDELHATLDNASLLLGQNRLDEALTNLNRAGVLVSQAQILLSNLQDATTTLSQQLGVLAAPAESKVTQAYNSLQSTLQRLTDLINQYHTLMQNINSERQTKTQQLQPTTLTLSLSTENITIGGSIYASGALTSEGQVLSNKQISLLLSSTQVASATTDSAGSFMALMTVPYNYVHVMTAQALYTPLGGDINQLEASLSQPLTINVTFSDTYLNVSLPNVAYPGLPLSVSGSVISQTGNALSGRTINILLDGNLINQKQSNSNGIFSIQTVINSQEAIGSHNLTIAVDPSGIYAGVTQQTIVYIRQMDSSVNVQVPSLVFLPSQIQVNGIVQTVSGPLNKANITVEFDSASAVTQSLENGSFNVNFNVPLNVGLGGFQNLKITVVPQEPWQSLAQKQTSVLVLNSVGLGVALISSFSVFGIAFTKFTKTKSKTKSQIVLQEKSLSSTKDTAEPKLDPKVHIIFEGSKGKMLEVYQKALQTVEGAIGVSVKQEMTLREFLQESQQKLGQVASQFSELTGFAERALYSPRIPKEQDLTKAEELLNEIKGLEK